MSGLKTVAGLPIPSVFIGTVEDYWQRFVDAIDTLPTDRPSSDVPASAVLELCSSRPELIAVWAASDFVAKTCIGNPLLLYALISSGDLDQPYASGELTKRNKQALDGCEDEAALHTQLRKIRQREMVRIAWRDLSGVAELEETIQCASQLAESCIEQALTHHQNWLSQRYGKPCNEQGDKANMVVLGLGKLGGCELNYSSDVDLIFAYDSPGQTAPIDNHHDKTGTSKSDTSKSGTSKSGIDNQEFFIKLGRKIVAALDAVTQDGFVFRTDMRLRPNGDSGPLALSFLAMEQYYQTHGRNWERYALIKARVVAGDKDSGNALLTRLKPFIYRKYLDFGAFESIREMKSMIEQALTQTGGEHNIKLGWGGIREIEFFVQSHQLIRGGREKELQTQSLYQALPSLVALGVIDDAVQQQLLESYRFLRNTEHRLQMVADRQTQLLPESEIEQQRLAWSMGSENWPAYVEKLNQHRTYVHGQFKMILDTDTEQAAPVKETRDTWTWLTEQSSRANPASATESHLTNIRAQTVQKKETVKMLHAAGFAQTLSTVQLLRGFRYGRLYQAFSEIERDRIDRLMPLAIQQAAQHEASERALAAFVSVVEAIGRRSVYLSLLIENPIALKQLLHLCAASPWIASHIGKHPIILDELLNPLAQQPVVDIRNRSHEALHAELEHRLAQVDLDDEEKRVDTLREYQQAQVLRIAAADVSGLIKVDDVHHALTQLAEVLLQSVFYDAVKFVEKKFGVNELMAQSIAGSIAYGKLASGELGYNSDLDVVVCYEKAEEDQSADDTEAEHFYSRVGRRFIHLLTTRSQAGILYELDMRLRPSGYSGMLVTSLSGFFDYQFNNAWTWEHQALVRSRVVVGNAEFQKRFEATRKEILSLKRDDQQLKEDVISMRRKMIDANCQSTEQVYDIKLDEGGIVDIEFLIQYWILHHANEHTALAIPRTTADSIDALVEHSIIDASTGKQLLNCYQTYLRHSLDLKLMELPVLVKQNVLLAERDAIKIIWNKTFG